MRKPLLTACLALAVVLSAGACSGRGAPPAAPTPPSTPAAPEVAAPAVTLPPPAPAAPVAVDIRGGGAPGLNTVIESIAVAPLAGGADIRITFRDGVPVWSAHVGVHGQQLFLDLGAPLVAGLTKSGRGADLPVTIAGAPSGALVTVAAIPERIQYEVAAADRALTVRARKAGRTLEVGPPPANPGMERADSLVAAFLQARVGTSVVPTAHLSDLARLQYQHLYGNEPKVVKSYRDWRQSAQWPGDAAFHLVRVAGDGWFADEMIYVTANDGEPQIALVLGHPPVAVPADPDGQAALRTAESFLDAQSRRDREAMWAALSPSARAQLGSVQAIGAGLSNPHAFRFEIQGLRQAAPDCWRFDVLRSQEYTGEGELGWAVGPLFVTKEAGRLGALWDKSCGE